VTLGDATITHRRITKSVAPQRTFSDASRWFAELDRLRSLPFMEKGRRKAAAPPRKPLR
jgi:hypothetical protein